MRALRKQLLAELNSNDYFREWEAWKIIDSGAAGNWWVFLLYRFWDLGDSDILIEPMWKRILCEYADALAASNTWKQFTMPDGTLWRIVCYRFDFGCDPLIPKWPFASYTNDAGEFVCFYLIDEVIL